MLRAAQDRKAGGNITEVTVAGLRTVTDFAKNRVIEREIFDLRYSLYLRAAGTDQADLWPDPRLERITRTRPLYRDAQEVI